jgi:hypothetical protein
MMLWLATLFPSYAMLHRRVKRLEKRKKIVWVGRVPRQDCGHPLDVYGTRKVTCVEHEVGVSELCLCYREAAISRSYDVDPELREDAILVMGDETYHLEWDTGTEGYEQVMRKFKRYEGCDDCVLWVTSTEERREGLRRRAKVVKDNGLFAVVTDVVANPHGEVWLDFDGARHSIVV